MRREDVPIFPDLAGKLALVTGGSKGIGAETVRALAANGVRVAVNGRDVTALDALVEEIDGDVFSVPASVDRWDDVVRMREAVGPVDILVLFAGGFGARTPVQDISEDEWHRILDSNLTGTFLCIKAFLPSMIARGRGTIVTMASVTARHLDAALTASYAAAKAGVIQLTRHVALEAGPHGVRANCIAPGTTTSERVLRNLDADKRASMAVKSPLGRLATPEEPAMAALFLCSDIASGFMTGTTVDISGGRVMQ